MRVILGTTKDTSTGAHEVRARPPTNADQTRQKMEQVKAYFTAIENSHNPLHEAVKDTKECRLGQGRGKSWMGQAQDSILQVSQLTELKQTKEWERYPNRLQRLYKTLLPENLGKYCGEWPAGKPESEIKLLISRPHYLIAYTDGPVTKDQSGWGFTEMFDSLFIYVVAVGVESGVRFAEYNQASI